jgi:hypothetical protein
MPSSIAWKNGLSRPLMTAATRVDPSPPESPEPDSSLPPPQAASSVTVAEPATMVVRIRRVRCDVRVM